MTLGTMANQSSEVGDDRPIAACQFSPDGTRLASGAWSGAVKVWSMPDCQKQLTIKAHSERITGLAWSPEASTSGAAWWAAGARQPRGGQGAGIRAICCRELRALLPLRLCVQGGARRG